MPLIVSASAIFDERNLLSYLYHVVTVTCNTFLDLLPGQNCTPFLQLIVSTKLQHISGINSEDRIVQHFLDWL